MTPYLNPNPGPDRASKERLMVHEFEYRCRGKLSPGKLIFKRDVCLVLSCLVLAGVLYTVVTIQEFLIT